MPIQNFRQATSRNGLWMMEIDKKLHELPLTKFNPNTLLSLFGATEITPMWVADMEFEIAKPIQDALMERISSSGFGYEYKPDSYYSAQKRWYEEKYNIELDRKQILNSPSITTTIAVLIENFTEVKDGIIIQPPVFMEFKDVIRKTKRVMVKNPLKLSGGRYEIDFVDLEKKARTAKNKILILCNPHNPVGRVWTTHELERVITICQENNLLLISDEIHKDIILFDNKFNSLLKFEGILPKMIVCTSEAKSFNLCGISDSLAIIPDEEIRGSVSATFKKYNLGRTNALTRVALEAAYQNGDDWLKEAVAQIEKNVETIGEELRDSRIKLIQPEGTYQVWLDFRGIYEDSKVMFQHLTAQSGVGMNAGHWFGREGALFMRMNIATSHRKVLDSIRKIKKSVQQM